jgi:hypothetical protein
MKTTDNEKFNFANPGVRTPQAEKLAMVLEQQLQAEIQQQKPVKEINKTRKDLIRLYMLGNVNWKNCFFYNYEKDDEHCQTCYILKHCQDFAECFGDLYK